MTICDKSAMVAIAVGTGVEAVSIASAIQTARLPLISSEACITEAAYLTRSRFGWGAQHRLLELIAVKKSIVVHSLQPDDWDRILKLMTDFHDLPMDFADATLIVLAERFNLNNVLTLDSDFLIYRKRDGTAFNILNQVD